MANDQEASSSNSNSNSNSTRTRKYDVFLSFNGEDTRRGFTDHLYSALCAARIGVFRDDDELRRGEEISQGLIQAIENSHFAIIVLSYNYASSRWCLDELQHILASKKNQLGRQVIPIFYYVDPSDVRHRKGSFGYAFSKLESKFRKDQEKLEKWRDSLAKVANISGWTTENSRYESELIRKVIDHLWNEFCHLPSDCNSDDLVGIDWKISEIESFFMTERSHLEKKLHEDDIGFLGIWGMGGVGKTTLARAIHKRFRSQFDFDCFLADVSKVSETRGLVDLQRQILSHLNIKNKEIKDTYDGKDTIPDLLRNKKVMLILDDVSSISQLENLAGSPRWFGDGSRIIITTRNLHLLVSHIDGVETYEVKPMNNAESFQLFCQKAFKRNDPKEGFRDLAFAVIEYARGLPLALSVLGSFFCGKDDVEAWEVGLDMLREDLPDDIFKILEISYNALNSTETTIFLDIACFFNMWGTDEITEILESCGLHAKAGLLSLKEKSLLAEIEIGNSKYIVMHDMIQEMGRKVVIKDSRNTVQRRSRLWTPKDINRVLETKLGTKSTRGVVLPFSFSFEKNQADWNPKAFLGMCGLQLLSISCNDLPRGLEGFPCTLNVLHWYGYPLEALPSKEKLHQLVYLKMQKSKLTRLLNKDNQCLKNLKILDMSHSKYLIESPSFLGLENLERLVLEGCTKLVEIHSSLGVLNKLIGVNLKGCTKLKNLPRKLEMNSLKELILCGCTQITSLPEFGDNMENLITLDVKETGIAELPESLGSLINLQTLNLRHCQNLVGLPHNIHKLKHLKVLDISSCSTFSRLPNNLNENEALEMLDASKTAITRIPPSIAHLKELKTLSFQGCSFPTSLIFPRCIFNIKSLRELDLSYCNIKDRSIPNDLSGLASMQKLDLSGNLFVSLHTHNISKLFNLRFLYLNSCPRLRSLPQPSPALDLMDARDCTSLTTLSDKKLLRLLVSIDQHGKYAERLSRRMNTHSRASLSIKNFSTTIPGSEIPSGFKNQISLSLNEGYESSIIIDVPPDEWLGFVLCTVLEDDKAYLYMCCWRYYFAKASDGNLVFLQKKGPKLEKEINSPHLWILYGQIRKHNGPLSTDFRQLLLKFEAQKNNNGINFMKCGWRVIREEDIEVMEFMEQDQHLVEHKMNDRVQGLTETLKRRSVGVEDGLNLIAEMPIETGLDAVPFAIQSLNSAVNNLEYELPVFSSAWSNLPISIGSNSVVRRFHDYFLELPEPFVSKRERKRWKYYGMGLIVSINGVKVAWQSFSCKSRSETLCWIPPCLCYVAAPLGRLATYPLNKVFVDRWNCFMSSSFVLQNNSFMMANKMVGQLGLYQPSERATTQSNRTTVTSTGAWRAPEEGSFCVSVNGAYDPSNAVSGCAALIRNHKGKFLQGLMMHIGRGNRLHAELWAFLMGLMCAWDAGIRNVVLESDAANAINILKEPVDEDHPERELIEEVTTMLKREWNVSTSYRSREGNKAAGFLAKSSISLAPGFHYVAEPPAHLVRLLRVDAAVTVSGVSQENTRCCEVEEEQGECSLSISESYETTIKDCDTKSPEPSSPCLLEEVKIDDSQLQFVSDKASDCDSASPISTIAMPPSTVQSPNLSSCRECQPSERATTQENTRCSEAQEQRQCSLLSLSENSEIIINKCESMSLEASSPCLEDESKLNDLQMQFTSHDISHCDIANSTMAMPPSTVQLPSSSNCRPCVNATTQEASICVGDSIDGTHVPDSVPKQNPSIETNHAAADSLSANATISQASMPQTSAEKIFEELSQVSGLEQTELLQIYDILTSDQRKFESFKVLPSPLRKPWILMQIKKYYS